MNDALAWVRLHPERYFVDGMPTAIELARSVWSDAIFCGSSEVVTHYERHSDIWVIAAQAHWLDTDAISAEELFTRIVPLAGAGPNSMRSEIVVNAFCNEVAAFDSSRYVFTKGTGLVKSALNTLLMNWPSLGAGIAFRL